MTTQKAMEVLSIMRQNYRGCFKDEIAEALDVAIDVLAHTEHTEHTYGHWCGVEPTYKYYFCSVCGHSVSELADKCPQCNAFMN